MAQAGEELVNATLGQTLIFRRTTADTGGELLGVESIWAPEGAGEPLLHLHPIQSEHFVMLEGELAARVGDERLTLRPGDVLDVPPGTPHAMWNSANRQTRATWEISPALRTEQFFETMWKLAADGHVNAKGTPGLLRSAVILGHFDREFRVVSPPYAVQRAVFGVLAPLGRLRGYKPTYP